MKYKNTTFVIDTSALLFDPNALTYYTESVTVLPISVIQELDKHKDRPDEVGANARSIIRSLYELKKIGNLNKGVKCPVTNVTIQIMPESLEDVPESLDRNLPDDRILSICLTLKKKNKKSNIHLVTNDLNLSLKAEGYGIDSSNFQPENKYVKTDYKGHREILDHPSISIDEIYKKGAIVCPEDLEAIENEYFLIKTSANKQSVRCRYKEGFLVKLSKEKNCYHIEALNNEQAYALDLLMDPDIKLVTLTGLAGSGKTLLSVAAGLKQCIEEDPIYEKMLISRSLVVLSGKDKLGFLKGSLREKLDPYILPMKDAIDQILGDKSGGLDYLTATAIGPDMTVPNKPKIEIEPLLYIRGRSLRDVYFIIDESQNLSLNEVKTIISRAGDNCKIILLGDLHQIDSPYLNKYTNGLAQVIEKLKGSKIVGHISLIEGVRSELATEAALKL